MPAASHAVDRNFKLISVHVLYIANNFQTLVLLVGIVHSLVGNIVAHYTSKA